MTRRKLTVDISTLSYDCRHKHTLLRLSLFILELEIVVVIYHHHLANLATSVFQENTAVSNYIVADHVHTFFSI